MSKPRQAITADLIISGLSSSPHERTIEARRIRKHLILKSLLDHGAMSRIDLARHLEFNYRSTALLVDEMVQERLVIQEKIKVDQGRGRPPQPVRLNANAAMIMGLSLHRNGNQAIMMNLAGEVLSESSVKRSPAPSVESRIRLCDELSAGVRTALNGKGAPLAGIGVALDSPVDLGANASEDAQCFDPTSPAGAIHHALHQSWNVPVLIESHARTKAMASHWFGVGRSYESFVYVNLDDAPGLGVVMNHQMLQGVGGYAGEISLAPEFASKRLQADDGNLDGLVNLLAQAAVFYNPEAIIIGGAGAMNQDGLTEQLRDAFARLGMPPRLAQTALHVCDLGDRALVLGAAAIVLHHIYYPAHISVAQVL